MEKTMKELMQWRFACKHFTDQKLDDATLHELLDNARMSPSSYGLQAWKFIVVTNKDLKQKLAPACYSQPQITESSALVFFCARTDIEGENGVLNRFIKKSHADLNKTDEESAQFKAMLEGDLLNRTPEARKAWAQRQVYIPLMTLITSAAEKGIDSCPMEGFVPDKVAEALELPEYLHPTAIVALGYRNMEQPRKTRFDFEEVVEIRS